MINKSSNLLYVSLLTLVATLGGFLLGYDTAVISGTVGSLQSFFIDSLFSDSEKALRVIWEYRLTVIAVILIISFAVSGILIKLLGKNRGLIGSVIMVILLILILFLNFRNEAFLDEETANSLKGFTISSALVGCILGGALGGFISRVLGRKKGLITAAILFTVSAIGSSVSRQHKVD